MKNKAAKFPKPFSELLVGKIRERQKYSLKNIAIVNWTAATILVLTLLVISGMAQLRVSENVPVGFFGKVVDQEGQPVVEARVTCDFIISHMAEDRTDTSEVILQTDQFGSFALTGITGYGIDKISVTKKGYQLSPKTLRSYTFGLKSDYKPNPDNPIIFKMWKESGKEVLEGSSWRGKVACDGTTNCFDLISGKPSPEGNLEMTCTRDPLNYEPTNRFPYAYKYEIQFIGGGVQAADDEFSYLAPADGYSAKVTIERKLGDPKWRAGIDQEFYFKTSEGHYGRISVVWDAGHRPPPTIMRWECSINPSGSRNLER
ncbi:MAG TPA: carboxypeptidase-like regulatory domain-containing protein [Verrucomicrobiae bacterium]